MRSGAQHAHYSSQRCTSPPSASQASKYPPGVDRIKLHVILNRLTECGMSGYALLGRLLLVVVALLATVNLAYAHGNKGHATEARGVTFAKQGYGPAAGLTKQTQVRDDAAVASRFSFQSAPADGSSNHCPGEMGCCAYHCCTGTARVACASDAPTDFTAQVVSLPRVSQPDDAPGQARLKPPRS